MGKAPCKACGTTAKSAENLYKQLSECHSLGAALKFSGMVGHYGEAYSCYAAASGSSPDPVACCSDYVNVQKSEKLQRQAYN